MAYLARVSPRERSHLVPMHRFKTSRSPARCSSPDGQGPGLLGLHASPQDHYTHYWAQDSVSSLHGSEPGSPPEAFSPEANRPWPSCTSMWATAEEASCGSSNNLAAAAENGTALMLPPCESQSRAMGLPMPCSTMSPEDTTMACTLIKLGLSTFSTEMGLLQSLLGMSNVDAGDVEAAVVESGCAASSVLAAYLHNLRIVDTAAAGSPDPGWIQALAPEQQPSTLLSTDRHQLQLQEMLRVVAAGPSYVPLLPGAGGKKAKGRGAASRQRGLPQPPQSHPSYQHHHQSNKHLQQRASPQQQRQESVPYLPPHLYDGSGYSAALWQSAGPVSWPAHLPAMIAPQPVFAGQAAQQFLGDPWVLHAAAAAHAAAMMAVPSFNLMQHGHLASGW